MMSLHLRHSPSPAHGLAALALTLSLVSTATTAQATEESSESSSEEDRHEEVSSSSSEDSKDRHRAWHLSFTSKALAGLVYDADGHSEGLVGFGGQFDFPLVEHELEIEIGATYHKEHTLAVTSAEMLFAHVFDAGRVVQPYVGIGPVIFLMDGKLDAAFQTSLGTNLWTRGHWGAHIESNYVRIFSANLDEVSLGLGVSFRY